MTLKLIKTNTYPICTNCKLSEFIRAGIGWVCLNCDTYAWPKLTGDINSTRNIDNSKKVVIFPKDPK
jgi:hypothetical protein